MTTPPTPPTTTTPSKDMRPFELLGPLPEGTTVLEASAGTGKTYTVGALVTRYVAEGVTTLDQMLVITFGRAASQELRERVRAQLVEVGRALADPAAARASGDPLVTHLATGPDDEVARRRRRVTDALADFDGATIATTHQFCHMVLRSLGVAGDTDSHAVLVEDLTDLVVEVVDDLYLQRFGREDEKPPFDRAAALALAAAAVDDPQAEIVPADAPPTSRTGARVDFARAVRAEVERRKQRLGILSYDDLLSRLATALDSADAPARERMRTRWQVVLVDEFQDTDPVQWQVIDRAFSGHATVVLIGDPKQAIYAFRGGDVVSYLDAARTAGSRQTLVTNYRSDGPLVDALQAFTRGAALGHPEIAVHPVSAHHGTSRLDGPSGPPPPVRMRVVPHDADSVKIADLRRSLSEDLADQVADLLTSGTTFTDPDHGVRDLVAGDVAILMFSLNHAEPFRIALARRGIPSVLAVTGSVLTSPAGDQWLALLEALERQQSSRVRTLALTPFIGLTPEELDAGGEERTDELAEQVRGWRDLFRQRGIAAVHEAVVADGLPGRVLSTPAGERHLTDLDHVAEVLHDVARRERLGLSALLEWLRTERRLALPGKERSRRLDTDAAAVQIVTVHSSKGLQYPVVMLPLLFDKWVNDERESHRFHAGPRRLLDLSGKGNATDDVVSAARAEDAAEELRLTYVALTRAQSQVVVWWAPSWNSGNSGLSRLLFGRDPSSSEVPDRLPRVPSEGETAARLSQWAREGAFVVEQVGTSEALRLPDAAPDTTPLSVRPFDRAVDTAWRRTSYSALIRVEEQGPATAGVVSEPESAGTTDEDLPVDEGGVVGPGDPPADRGPVSPMEALPAGAQLGSLVHGVLEHADPQAPDLGAELRARVAEQVREWPVDATVDAVAEALVPLQHTPLGPLAGDLALAEIGLPDRLRELDFEIPLDGGDLARRPGAAGVTLGEVGDLMRRHLPEDDPLLPYADRIRPQGASLLGDQALRGYLSGSIDVVLRVAGSRVDGGPGDRFVVVDYKTNRLGTPGQELTALDYTPDLMAEAMLHSHYPLQAMLYSAVLHRFLRWRLPGYDPQVHLGGVLYLYVRGMCGPDTPVVDGAPCGVFTWRPPAAMVVELSDLLAGRATGEATA